jgi:hypothetical protein
MQLLIQLLVQWLMTDDDEYLPQVDPHIKEEAKDENNKVG